MAALSLELSSLLEDVDTAPEGQPLDDALDALLDFVQAQRGPIIAGLAAVQTPPPPQDQAVLRDFLQLLEHGEGVTYVPAAVSRRGTAHIPTPVPEHMTEERFQLLLEAEAAMMDQLGRGEMGDTLRVDLKRRRSAIEAQARRDAQIAALGPPLAGRRTIGISP